MKKIIGLLICVVMLIGISSSIILATAESSVLLEEDNNQLLTSKINDSINKYELDYITMVMNNTFPNNKTIFTPSFADIVSDFNCNPNYIVVDFYPTGYSIFDREYGVFLEKVAGAKSFYSKIYNEKYYAGLGMYYEYNNGKYLDLRNDCEINSNFLKYLFAKSEVLSKKIKNSEERKTEKYYLSKIDNPEYEKSMTTHFLDYGEEISLMYQIGNNTSGTCSKVAAGIMLKYLDDHHNSDFIPSTLWSGLNPDLNAIATYLINEIYGGSIEMDELLDYFADHKATRDAEKLHLKLNQMESGSLTIIELEDLLEDYINMVGLNNTVSRNTIYFCKNFVKTKIENDQPCVLYVDDSNTYEYLTGDLQLYSNNFAGDHAVIVYGYGTEGTLPNEYYCNLGWWIDNGNLYTMATVSALILDSALSINI